MTKPEDFDPRLVYPNMSDKRIETLRSYHKLFLKAHEQGEQGATEGVTYAPYHDELTKDWSKKDKARSLAIEGWLRAEWCRGNNPYRHNVTGAEQTPLRREIEAIKADLSRPDTPSDVLGLAALEGLATQENEPPNETRPDQAKIEQTDPGKDPKPPKRSPAPAGTCYCPVCCEEGQRMPTWEHDRNIQDGTCTYFDGSEHALIGPKPEQPFKVTVSLGDALHEAIAKLRHDDDYGNLEAIDYVQCVEEVLRAQLAKPDYTPDASFLRVHIVYTNHKGIKALRRIKPIEIVFTETPWHPEPQWLLRAHDFDKDAERLFAMRDIEQWMPLPVL